MCTQRMYCRLYAASIYIKDSCRWDDNRLRSYLEEKGVIKTKQQATRDQLLAKMKESYASVANPVWSAWSDSYIVRTCSFTFC
jgi:hypothetical protein